MPPLKLKSILFACLILACPLVADETDLTLERAIEIALGESYTVRSYQERKQAMEHDYRYYQAQFDPRLDLTLFAPSWNENVLPIQRADGLPVYNSTGTMQYSSRLRFTYMLPTGGNLSLSSELRRVNEKTVLALSDYQTLRDRKAQSSFSLNFEQPVFTRNELDENLDAARLRYEKASCQFTRQQVEIIFLVTQSFYKAFRCTRELEIAVEKLANSDQALDIARLKAEAGRIAEGEVLTAEVTAAENRAALSERQGDLERAADALKQLIGLDLHQTIQVSVNLKYDSLTVDPEGAIERALASRLELTEAQLDYELGKIDLDRAGRIRQMSGKVSAYYDITGVSTREHGSTMDLFNSSFDNFVDRPPNRGITLSVSVPVFDWGRGRESVQREMANLRQAKLEIENERNTIIRQVRDIVRTVDEAGSRLRIHERNQDLARNSYRISRLRFDNGSITSQDLALAQERLAASQLNYLQAYIDYQLSLAELKKQTLWDFENGRSYVVEQKYSTDRRNQ